MELLRRLSGATSDGTGCRLRNLGQSDAAFGSLSAEPRTLIEQQGAPLDLFEQR